MSTETIDDPIYEDWVDNQQAAFEEWVEAMERRYEEMYQSGVPIFCVNCSAA